MVLNAVKRYSCFVEYTLCVFAFVKGKVGYADIPDLSFVIKPDDLSKMFFNIRRKMQPIYINITD